MTKANVQESQSEGEKLFQTHILLYASRQVVQRLLNKPDVSSAIVLNLTDTTAANMRSRSLDATSTISYPAASSFLADVLADPSELDEKVEIFIPRAAFDNVDGSERASRFSSLDLKQGVAKGDDILAGLSACLRQTQPADSAGHETIISYITSAIHAHIACRYGRGIESVASPARGGLASWQLKRARRYLEENLDKSITLADVAQTCGLSTAHFSRAFTQSTGVSPHRWLMLRRVEMVKDLLRADDLSLAEIALACGFADQSHLTRVFTSATGTPPRRWKRSESHEISHRSIERDEATYEARAA